MPRPIFSAFLIACALTGWPGIAQADPRIVYTRHALTLDIRDLDLTRDADRRVLQARIADAADEVCGGRPDRGNRYTQAEQTRLWPAYEKCRADAVRRVQVSLNLPALAGLAQAGMPRP